MKYIIKPLSLDDVRQYLKVSKSEPTDDGPYSAEREVGNMWYDILDKNRTVVGQADVSKFLQPGESK